MGCVSSSDREGSKSSLKDGPTAISLPTGPINEIEIDLTHFTAPKEILGIGGFGVVRRVIKNTCADGGSSYAMKSIAKATILARPSGAAAVMTELKALILVRNSEYICNLQYAFQDEAFLYMIFEYAIGGDMRFNLRKAHNYRFSETLSKMIIRQVFLALDHCHNCSILHRDVKPENILLYADGHTKLTDFGVAKILPNIEMCRSTSGTHGYMAPEIYTDDHVHGTTFDWFCVGITLHEFLTGRRPYEAVRLQRYFTSDTLDRLELDYLPRMPVSKECISFVTELLRPEPSIRLGAISDIREIFAHPWLQHERTIDFPTIVNQLKSELPSFQVLFDERQMSRHDLNRVNISRDEAISIVRQHQQSYVIAHEVQSVFRDFEFNTKVDQPLFPSLMQHTRGSRKISCMPSTSPRSSGRFHRCEIKDHVDGTLMKSKHEQEEEVKENVEYKSVSSSLLEGPQRSLRSKQNPSKSVQLSKSATIVEDVDVMDITESPHKASRSYPGSTVFPLGETSPLPLSRPLITSNNFTGNRHASHPASSNGKILDVYSQSQAKIAWHRPTSPQRLASQTVSRRGW